MLSLYSHARLVVDVVSMRLFVWIVAACFPAAADAGGGVLDSHLFFYHRYTELADWHRSRGRVANAEELEAVAEAYYQAAPGDGDDPPEAATMAMPVPRPPLNTNAVSTIRVPRRRPEPPSNLVPSH